MATSSTPNSASEGTAAPHTALDARSLIAQIHALARTELSEMDWDRYCSLMRQLCKASHGAVVRLADGVQNMELLGLSSEQSNWTPLQAMPPGVDLLSKASDSGYAQAPAQAPDGQSWLVLVVALQGLTACFLILNIKPLERAQLNELTLRALLCADFHPSKANMMVSAPADGLTSMLGLAAEVMQQSSVGVAALSLVNGIAIEWKLLHASLGWVQDGQIQVAAISHLDRFEKNSPQTQRLESAMGEALVQGHEVYWSAAQDQTAANQAIAELADKLGVQRITLLPLQDAQGITQALLLLAFSPEDSAQPDLSHLQLTLDLIQPRLTDLRMRSLDTQTRLKHQLKQLSERVFGPEHATLKLITVVLSVLLLYIIFGSWNYRVDARAQLNTDSTRLISAQFDGRIERVHATSGDLVKAGVLLVSLDTRELEQQRNELTAEISKAETEVNKNRAEGRLAETQIAQARLEQSRTKAQRVERYLQQANSTAPFEGVIVEGEKKDLLGVPVKKGDKIFKIAKVEGLYVTLMVTERQMRHVRDGATGELSLISHPEHSIPIRLNSVIPVAQVKGQEGNQFMITAQLLETPQPWWRPGMTGLARINVGDKNIGWILTHRVVDNLRLMLWW